MINANPVSVLVDTSVATTSITDELWEQVCKEIARLESWIGQNLFGVFETPLIKFMAVHTYLARQKFLADVMMLSPISTEAILGFDFLLQYSAIINLAEKSLHSMGHSQDLWCQGAQADVARQEFSPGAQLGETIHMLPHSDMEVMAVVEGTHGNAKYSNSAVFLSLWHWPWWIQSLAGFRSIWE